MITREGAQINPSYLWKRYHDTECNYNFVIISYYCTPITTNHNLLIEQITPAVPLLQVSIAICNTHPLNAGTVPTWYME